MEDLVLKALNTIDPSALTYSEWTQVGMALKAEGYSVDVWEDWSSQDFSRYHKGECYKKWNTFHGEEIKGGTIVQMAKDGGFYIERGHALEWDDEIQFDEAGAKAPWNRKADIKLFLETLYKPDDYVCYVTNDVYKDEDGKWKPGKGVYYRTVRELLEKLPDHEFEDVFDDTKPECGAWICVNALDGKGRYNKNVTDHRYVLVESDTMPIEQQEQYFRTSGLPIATLTLSGGKSVHALVRVDAANSKEYAERVAQLYEKLKADGMELDEQNKNPSRLTRMPGVYRGHKEQRLLAVNIGPRSWAEWQARLINADLPPVLSSEDFVNREIVLAPVLIEGILRQGHKMIISGESKSGKTWSLIELAWAIASGTKWLGKFQCAQGSVLYINLEVDQNSFAQRAKDVRKELAIDCVKGFYTWNLRGKAQTLDKLMPAILEQCKILPNLKLVIIDPIYKINPGDENNAGEMGAFCNLFDRICEEGKTSVAFCHHFSKGAQGAKRSIDRASGSGVFARDPDAILTMTRLVKQNDDQYPAYRLESSLREFKDIEPLNLWFKWPIHVLDVHGVLEKRGMVGSAEGNLQQSGKRSRTDEDKMIDFENAFEATTQNDVTADIKGMAEYLDISERSIKNYAKMFDGKYRTKGGMVILETNSENGK